MSSNLIQFQSGLSLYEFIKLYGTQTLCEAVLESTRWPNGFCCLHCSDTRTVRIIVPAENSFNAIDVDAKPA